MFETKTIGDFPKFNKYRKLSTTFDSLFSQCLHIRMFDSDMIDYDTFDFNDPVELSKYPGDIFLPGVSKWNKRITTSDVICLAHELTHVVQDHTLSNLECEREAYANQGRVCDELEQAGIKIPDKCRPLSDEEIIESTLAFYGES
jgi:hypothetical protein